MEALNIATRSYIDALINKRSGETKLGETVQLTDNDWVKSLGESKANFVLLGIPEDIGVRANYGVGGAHTAWEPALKALLNTQETTQLSGNSLFVLGAFDFKQYLMQADFNTGDVTFLRELVALIDEAVYPVIQQIISLGKIPIVIGGGHNNAYPLLKGTSLAINEQVNCINLDAHSDYRVIEGRHSGNGFRYAKHEGYLKKYAVIGLHEAYNAQHIIDEFKTNDDLHYSMYEDIFIREKMTFGQATKEAITHTSGRKTGIELDLDCIERVLSSATSPSGITSLQARQYVYNCAQQADIAYLHLTEGAIKLRNGREDAFTGKLIAYLAADFMKGYAGRIT